MADKKGGLGRGLDSLFNANSEETLSTEVMLSQIEPNRDQPRKDFDEQALNELADSIKEHGLLQPILVRSKPTGGYEIIAGERRWRASRIAGLRTVPVVIKEMDEKEAAEVALIENLQREDLNPVEEAMGYRSLMVSYGLTQEQVAERVGKSRPAVANSVRLLELPHEVLGMLKEGQLSAGHARAILSLNNAPDRVRVAEVAVKKGMSVRDIEKFVKRESDIFEKKPRKQHNEERSSFLDEVEIALSEVLGRRVKVSGTDSRGTLEVDFFSPEELGEMARRLGQDM